jgi:periplasmic protein TonB
MPTRRSLLVLASVAAHAAILMAIFVASLMATGTLPTPMNRLAFEIDHAVRVMDITLPARHTAARHPRPDDAAAPLASAVVAAPLDAPSAIAPDTSDAVASGVEFSTPGGAPIDSAANTFQGLGIPGIVETPPAPPASPQSPIRIGSGLVAPRKTFNVDPAYPNIARTARVEGVVILEAVIDQLGRVESVRVLRSIPLLDQAALDAVRQWRFTPTLLNGTPVSIVMMVTVNFSLSAR